MISVDGTFLHTWLFELKVMIQTLKSKFMTTVRMEQAVLFSKLYFLELGLGLLIKRKIIPSHVLVKELSFSHSGYYCVTQVLLTPEFHTPHSSVQYSKIILCCSIKISCQPSHFDRLLLNIYQTAMLLLTLPSLTFMFPLWKYKTKPCLSYRVNQRVI